MLFELTNFLEQTFVVHETPRYTFFLSVETQRFLGFFVDKGYKG